MGELERTRNGSGDILTMTGPELLQLVDDQERWTRLTVEQRDLARTRYVALKRANYLETRRALAEKVREEAELRRAVAMEEALEQRREEVRQEWEAAWEQELSALESLGVSSEPPIEAAAERDSGIWGVVGGLLIIVWLIPGVVWLVQWGLDALNGDRWATWPDAFAFSLGFGDVVEQLRFCRENSWSCADDLTLHWYVVWPLGLSVAWMVLFASVIGQSVSSKER